MDNRGNTDRFQMLSARETQLILLAGEGLTDKEIAKELGISLGTVITLWSKVRAKLAINSRVSAVAVMSAVVSRLNSRLPAFDQESADWEHMLGRLSGIRLMVNRRLIVLSCSSMASSVLGLRPGLLLSPGANLEVCFTNRQGAIVGEEALPWVETLRNDQDVFDYDLTVQRGDVSRTFSVDCYFVEDPLLNRVAVVDFKPIGQTLGETPLRGVVAVGEMPLLRTG